MLTWLNCDRSNRKGGKEREKKMGDNLCHNPSRIILYRQCEISILPLDVKAQPKPAPAIQLVRPKRIHHCAAVVQLVPRGLISPRVLRTTSTTSTVFKWSGSPWLAAISPFSPSFFTFSVTVFIPESRCRNPRIWLGPEPRGVSMGQVVQRAGFWGEGGGEENEGEEEGGEVHGLEWTWEGGILGFSPPLEMVEQITRTKEKFKFLRKKKLQIHSFFEFLVVKFTEVSMGSTQEDYGNTNRKSVSTKYNVVKSPRATTAKVSATPRKYITKSRISHVNSKRDSLCNPHIEPMLGLWSLQTFLSMPRDLTRWLNSP
ncbi:hypothetical protein DVH24_002877 [Malus domestica]|uniref:Uncharacterized protein n=1 Tax=Malus domestica TaxID=3750 RepID=A0A498K3M4_MALDO|nr:hypothetical protein DVH24_002877 [Malus domestica]